MFHFRDSCGTVGVAFTDAVGDGGGRLDLATPRGRWRSADWDVVEQRLGVPVLHPRQVHGTTVVAVDAGTDPVALAGTEADGLVSEARGIALAVRAADCLPVLVADPVAGVVGAAHAGRVGLAAGVLPALLEALAARGATDLVAWIGPSVCGSCYEVPASLRAEVADLLPGAWASTSWGTAALDLRAAAQEQLRAAGCRVVRVDACTMTTPGLHSHRRAGVASGRQAGLIWRS